eukprot:2083371-Lingulodinium_polyedra.AAC.1
MPWWARANSSVLPAVGEALRVVATDSGHGNRVNLYLRDDCTGVVWFVRLRTGYHPEHLCSR